jgi:hypothetical protein
VRHGGTEEKRAAFLLARYETGLLQVPELGTRGTGTDGEELCKLPDIIAVPRVTAKEYERLKGGSCKNVHIFEHMFIIMNDTI